MKLPKERKETVGKREKEELWDCQGMMGHKGSKGYQENLDPLVFLDQRGLKGKEVKLVHRDHQGWL